jgi:hypothetical protein
MSGGCRSGLVSMVAVLCLFVLVNLQVSQGIHHLDAVYIDGKSQEMAVERL